MPGMTLPLVWATLLSALAVSLAQPNEILLSGNPFLALLAWVPLLWALRQSTSNRMAAGLSAVFAFATTLFQDFWLMFFQDFAVWTIGGVALGLTLYGALLGPVLRTALRRKTPWRMALVGAVWAVFEYLKSNGFLGFPWGLAPYPFHQWVWSFQIVDITGLSFLSFLILSWNAWLSEFWERDGYFRVKTGAFFALMVVGLAIYGAVRLNEHIPSRGTAHITLIQQNGDPWNSHDDLGPLRTSIDLSTQALKTSSPDLIVWSETSLRLPLQYYRPYYERTPPESPLFPTIRDSHTWWLFGNPYAQDEEQATGWVNSTVLVNPKAQIVDYYGKIQQVPFAEYVPFWNVKWMRSFYESVVGLPGSWELGRKYTIFKVPLPNSAKSFKFATPICFEDAFPWINSLFVRHGAEVLVNLTNDSWSKLNSSEYQHYVASLYRAVENRVWLLRSSNSGVTCVIDSAGRVVEGPLPTFHSGLLSVDVPLAKKRSLTPYTQFGDWIVVLFMLWILTDLAFHEGPWVFRKLRQ